MISASVSRWALPRQRVDPSGLFSALPLPDGSYLITHGDGSSSSTTRKGWANLHPIQAGFAYHRGISHAQVAKTLGWFAAKEGTAEALGVLIRRGAMLHEGRLFDWYRAGFYGSAPS